MLYSGGDWASTKMDIAFLVGTDASLVNYLVAKPYFDSLKQAIQLIREKQQHDEVAIVIEDGSPVWAQLLHVAGATVHVVDNKQAKRFSESLHSGGSKDDKRDARMLAYMGQSTFHRPAKYEPKPSFILQLKTIQKEHDSIQNRRSREINQIRAALAENMPMVHQAIRSIDAKWAQAFLTTFPTAWHVQHSEPGEIEGFLSKTRVGEKQRNQVVEACKITVDPWQDAALAKTIAVSMRRRLQALQLTCEQSKECQCHLAALLEEHADEYQNISDIKGVGPHIMSTVLTEGLLEARDSSGEDFDRDSISKKLGASPVFNGSGINKAGQSKGTVHMRRNLNSRAKRTGHNLGRQVAAHTKWGRWIKDEMKARGCRMGTIYRALARRMARIISRIIVTGEAYDEAVFIERAAAQGAGWAIRYQSRPT